MPPSEAVSGYETISTLRLAEYFRNVTESWAPKVIYLILSEITGAYLGVSRIPGHATQASESDRPIFV